MRDDDTATDVFGPAYSSFVHATASTRDQPDKMKLVVNPALKTLVSPDTQ